MKKLLNWYKLDNSAKMYPVLITKNSQSLYRISVVLQEEVEPKLLEQALNDIMPRFPSFGVRLRYGLFWYYLEENNKPVKIFPDDGYLLKPIDVYDTNHYWFRVSYFGRKINIDFFHALSDANGGFEFFKTLLHQYYTLGGRKIGYDNVMNLNDSPTVQETEDCFYTNYTQTSLKNVNLKSVIGENPLNLSGTTLKGGGYGTIMGTMSVQKTKEKAKEYGVGLNSFLCAVLINAIVLTYGIKAKQKPIIMMIPVNLRKIFGGTTLRNFILFTRLSIMPSKDKTLVDYIKECDKQLKDGTTKEKMQEQLNTTVHSLKAPIFKFMPLPLKHLSVVIGKWILKARQTIIFSNVGKVSTPKDMNLDKVTLNLNCGGNSLINAGAIAYEDKLVVSFSRNIVETKLEKNFFTSLVGLGIDVKISSNYREEQYVL